MSLKRVEVVERRPLRTMTHWVLGLCLLLLGAGTASAQVSFQTGKIHGFATTGEGTPLPGIQVEAQSVSTSGTVSTQTGETGEYLLVLPEGTYDVSARYQSYEFGMHEEVVVAAQQQVEVDFTLAAGRVVLDILADGVPAQGGYITLQEPPPESCAIAQTCYWQDENGSCHCSVDGREFYCSVGSCYWMNTVEFSGYGSNGHVDILVPPGDYDISVMSGYASGQWGQVRVALLSTTVAEGETVSLGQIAYETGTVLGSVASGDAPMAGVTVRAVMLDIPGEISTSTDPLGLFTMKLPAGAYGIYLGYDNQYPVDPEMREVVGGQTVAVDFVVPGATVTGTVLRDGVPANGAMVEVVEKGPTSCDQADSCWWNDELGNCHCLLDGRDFHCDGGTCQWVGTKSYSAGTDTEGHFFLVVPPGDYVVNVRSVSWENWPLSQWGSVRVASQEISALAEDEFDLGIIAYETGFVDGFVTTCGAPLSQGMFRALAAGGHGEVTTNVQAGYYALRLPVGTYTVKAQLNWNLVMEETELTIEAGQVVDWSSDFGLGRLDGFVMMDGGPAQGANATASWPQPESCEIADSCNWYDPEGGNCHCTFDGREFWCSNGQCWWMNEPQYSDNTDASGTFSMYLPAGTYEVAVQSPNLPGQWGGILIGTVEAVIESCEITTIGAAANTVEPGQVGPVDLGGGVYVTFAEVLQGGGVTYAVSSSPQGGAAPDGVEFVTLYYAFAGDAVVVAPIQVCIPLSGIDPALLGMVRLYAWIGGQWVDVTAAYDPETGLLCGQVDSLGLMVGGVPTNQPPLAHAGNDMTVPADGSCVAVVALDASGSEDPDSVPGTWSGIADFQWYSGELLLGEGMSIEVQLPIGVHGVTLVVTDTFGLESTDSLVVKVIDSTPPSVTVGAPLELWPPNHQYAQVGGGDCILDVVDDCTPAEALQVALYRAWSDEAEDETGDGDGETVQDILLDCGENGVSVRAERAGSGNGRVYSIEWVVGDSGGNLAHAVCTVGIPHSKGKNAGSAVNDAPDFAAAPYSAVCALDSDLDGIPDEEDNCPGIANPTQADGDADGAGDVCDICPADDQDTCLTDPDGDGLPDTQDNCPNIANPLQEDADLDGKGDVCDPCPASPDPACTPEPPPPPPPPPPGGENCGDALSISGGGHFSGTLTGATDDILSNCMGGGLADFAMRFDIPLGYPMGVNAGFDLSGSNDVTYSLFKGGCKTDMLYTCLGGWGGLQEMTLTPGTYYLVAEGPTNPQGTLEGSVYSVWLTLEDLLTGDCLMPDADGDGLTSCDGDCDDADDTSFPGGIEACDGHDNNCDGQVDEMSGACSTGIPGICDPGKLSCDPDTLHVVCTPLSAPKTEICEDGKDNDCDGSVDEAQCEMPAGGEDCSSAIEVGTGGTFSGTFDGVLDDLPGSCFPGEPSPELIFRIGVPQALYPDGLLASVYSQSSPGIIFSLVNGPCEAFVNEWGCMGATKHFDFPLMPGEYFVLAELEPWMEPGQELTYQLTFGLMDPLTGECMTPDMDGDGLTVCNWDCDDNDPLKYFGAPEACNGIDDNCDGSVDNATGACDTGLLGVCAVGGRACQGDVEICKQTVYPKDEVCSDAKDNDCDGLTDELDCTELPAGETCETAIDASAGGVFAGTLDGATNDVMDFCFPGVMGDKVYKIVGAQPGGPIEVFVRVQATSEMGITVLLGECGGDMLMNCGWMGETMSFGLGGETAWIVVDGMGMPGEPMPADYTLTVALFHPDTGECAPPDGDGDGASICQWDCDDTDPLRYPGAQEVCDGVDNDCDGGVDNLWEPCQTGLEGLCAVGQLSCQGEGTVCEQTNWPGTEICGDGKDNDCDGLVDEDGTQDPGQSCEVPPPPPEGDCCEAHTYPGCGNPEIMDCVCMAMGMFDCCEMEWHPACADVAFEMCGGC